MIFKSEENVSSAGTYLKFGAEAMSSAMQARLVAAYESRKNMVTIGAMVFNSPRNNTHWKEIRCFTRQSNI